MPVELVHWNPSRPAFSNRFLRRLPFRIGVDNFGDMLGPLIVRAILSEASLSIAEGNGRLLTVGSILHRARPGDVVWGSGVNGKMPFDNIPDELDIRAVRGPLTRHVLEDRGHSVPGVLGDPALLWSRYFPRKRFMGRRGVHQPVIVIPNLNDWDHFAQDSRAVSPRSGVKNVIRAIAGSEFVVATSLHAIIVAESYGVPARRLASLAEADFKYDDYYLGTGRTAHRTASSVDAAIAMGGEAPPEWSPDALLRAFPYDIWNAEPAVGC